MIAGYADKVDASITDEAEKRKEEEKLFKADLKKAGWIYSECAIGNSICRPFIRT